MGNVISSSVGQTRFQLMLIAGFAASALLLWCIGIYGVVSWSTARRRNEIGVRLALGAASSNVRRTALTLATVAAPACYIPARRTTLTDPLDALRYE